MRKRAVLPWVVVAMSLQQPGVPRGQEAGDHKGVRARLGTDTQTHRSMIGERELPRLLQEGSETNLPVGTAPGAWERSRTYILGVAVLGTQTLLVAGLLVQARRRRGAEAALRRHEAELMESEEGFRVLSNSAMVMIWMSDAQMHRTHVNKAWLEFTGRTLEAERGNGWSDSIHPDDRPRAVNTMAHAIERREPFQVEYRLRRHDGQYRWMLDTGSPRLTATSELLGYVGSALDFTEVRTARAALSSLSRRLIEAQEQDRAWIARELHDDLGQRVVCLAMQLESVSRLPGTQKDLRSRVEDLGRQFADLSKDISMISHRLHPYRLDYLGLVAAAENVCRDIAAQHGVTVDFNHEGVPGDLPREIAIGLFRVLQEALTNAVKHSGTRSVFVTLLVAGGELRLEVADRGFGFDGVSAMESGGLGLVSMRERMTLLGGGLSIESRPGEGTRVRACVRLPPSDAMATSDFSLRMDVVGAGDLMHLG